MGSDVYPFSTGTRISGAPTPGMPTGVPWSSSWWRCTRPPALHVMSPSKTSSPSHIAMICLLDPDLSTAWTEGPYGEPARQLVDRHVARIDDRFTRYDRLAVSAAGDAERMVLTHGEPHAANTINTGSGMVLIDWDTALIAPRERDLWSLAFEEPASLHHYATKAGVPPMPDLLELYRLRWELTEVSLYVALFRAPHTDTPILVLHVMASATLCRRSAHYRHEVSRFAPACMAPSARLSLAQPRQAGPTLARIARPSSSARVNCGQWPVGRSM